MLISICQRHRPSIGGTMNFAEADYVMTNTPGMLRAMGGMMTAFWAIPRASLRSVLFTCALSLMAFGP
ncbi:hypothetical protein DPM13_15675 [Paracoccus mutanolyticus]|uniref:Uncharacterized protein n=2 Tax=Paracoccus mutanolyticus TaxID=1499308 RepID=A0ABN5M7C3_9RHOB|nr:hypothetical protein DPM13_15675 [Paracoccus mutanolyticus]